MLAELAKSKNATWSREALATVERIAASHAAKAPADLGGLLANGDAFEIRNFATPDAIAALPEKLVFNCTGLGARQLFGDTELQPVRGQLAVLLPQPEVRYAFAGGAGYMFPRADGIILGGTFERDVWDTTPDPADIARIVESHKLFFGGFRCSA